MTSVILAGGGTAGHVNPLLATAHALREEAGESLTLTVVGTREGLETTLVPAAGLPLRYLPRVPFPRRPNRAALTFPMTFRRAVAQAEIIIDDAGADVVVGFGGYVSTPMYRAAAKRGVPIVVHEGNALPGLANKLGARWARLVALTFEDTPLTARHGETAVVGLPLRPDITSLIATLSDEAARADLRAQAAAAFGLDPARPVLVVTGGSLGAQHLNEVIVEAAPRLTEHTQILHLTGKGKSAITGAPYAAEAAGLDLTVENTAVEVAPGYAVCEYSTRMDLVYALADAIICRSGVGMVAEVSSLGIPALFVPLPIGNGEQARNAMPEVAAGRAMLCADRDFTTEKAFAVIPQLLERPREIGQSIHTHAAEHLARHILRIAEEDES